MNRKIKFRGKRINNNEWVYGYYWVNSIATYITTDAETKHQDIQVIPETVGQFIGLKDKNGNDVYEGDYTEDFDVFMWCERRNGWSLNVYDFPTKEQIECQCYNCAGSFEIQELTEIKIKGSIYDELKQNKLNIKP